MTAEERITWLEAQLNQALEQLQETQEQLRMAQARIQELEKQKLPPPAFVKADVSRPKEKKPRKKRKPEQNGVRRRERPTQIVEHRVVSCPTCHLRLGGISLARLRQVIDVPVPPQCKSPSIAFTKAGARAVANGTKLPLTCTSRSWARDALECVWLASSPT